MKIIPFGTKKGQNYGMPVYADLMENKLATDDSSEEGEGGDTFLSSMDNRSPGRSKIEEVQESIEQIVGEPSLDNLMIILAAIGMSQIGIKVSNDGSSLSVTGIINFDEPDSKINRKD